MAETKQISFSYKEVVEALLNQEGITEGIWGIFLKFGIAAANVGNTDADLVPTAMVPVIEIGLQRMDEESNVAVDASKLTTKEGEGGKGRISKRPTKT